MVRRRPLRAALALLGALVLLGAFVPARADAAANPATNAASAASSAAASSSPPLPTTPPPTPTPQQQQHNQQLVDALSRGGPEAVGVGLSITAALISFHVGALTALERLGVVDLARSPMAGGSGGAVVAFSTCLGLSIEATTTLVEDLSLYCSTRASCAGMMDVPVRAANKRALQLAVAKARREGWPEAAAPAAAAAAGDPSAAPAALTDAELGDAIVRSRCRGRVQFAVSELTRGLPRRERAEGQQQRTAAGATTTTTPRRLKDNATAPAPAVATTADPADVLAHPSIPLAQTATSLPWRPWLVGDYAGGDEAIDVASASAFISYFSGPSSALPFRGRRVADALFTVPLPCPGEGDSAGADDGAPSSSSLPCLRISAALPETSLLPGTPALTKPDIAPFLRVPMLQGVSARAWQRRALLAGDRAASRALAHLGEMEAEAWAAEAGISPPARAGARPAEAGTAPASGKKPPSLPAASALLPPGAAVADERKLTTTAPAPRRIGPFVIGRAAAIATPPAAAAAPTTRTGGLLSRLG